MDLRRDQGVRDQLWNNEIFWTFLKLNIWTRKSISVIPSAQPLIFWIDEKFKEK